MEQARYGNVQQFSNIVEDQLYGRILQSIARRRSEIIEGLTKQLMKKGAQEFSERGFVGGTAGGALVGHRIGGLPGAAIGAVAGAAAGTAVGAVGGAALGAAAAGGIHASRKIRKVAKHVFSGKTIKPSTMDKQ